MSEMDRIADHFTALARRAGQLGKFSTASQRLEYLATVRLAMDILAKAMPDKGMQELIVKIRKECDAQEALVRL